MIAADINVAEVPPQMTAHARYGQRTNTKNDETDALLIARITLRDDDLPPPRPDGPVEELRLLVSYRRELIEARNRLINRLHADLEQIRCGYHHKITTPLTSPTALTKVSRLLSGDNTAKATIAKRTIRHIRELTRQIDVRHGQRHRTTRCQLRSRNPTPPQPWRKPPTQQSPTHRSNHPNIKTLHRRPPTLRIPPQPKKNQTRSHPSTQTPHLKPSLDPPPKQPPTHHRLT